MRFDALTLFPEFFEAAHLGITGRAFRDLALSGSGGPTVVAAGISEALIATAAGIAVAVSSAVIYNYFNFRLKHVLNSLNIFGQEIILMVDLEKEI